MTIQEIFLKDYATLPESAYITARNRIIFGKKEDVELVIADLIKYPMLVLYYETAGKDINEWADRVRKVIPEDEERKTTLKQKTLEQIQKTDFPALDLNTLVEVTHILNRVPKDKK